MVYWGRLRTEVCVSRDCCLWEFVPIPGCFGKERTVAVEGSQCNEAQSQGSRDSRKFPRKQNFDSEKIIGRNIGTILKRFPRKKKLMISSEEKPLFNTETSRADDSEVSAPGSRYALENSRNTAVLSADFGPKKMNNSVVFAWTLQIPFFLFTREVEESSAMFSCRKLPQT